MAPLATGPDLQVFLQDPDLDQFAADLAVKIASSDIRDHVGWSISQETAVQLTLDGRGERRIFLPTLLLTDVAEVVEDGVTLVADDDYQWSRSGFIRRINARWPYKERSIQPTITHGYATVPDSVRGVCLAVAGRIVNNPENVTSYSIDGVSERTGTAATVLVSVGLLDSEKKTLGRYMLPVTG